MTYENRSFLMNINPIMGCERGELHCIKKIASWPVLDCDSLDKVNGIHLE
jgi:hypothetical protein